MILCIPNSSKKLVCEKDMISRYFSSTRNFNVDACTIVEIGSASAKMGSPSVEIENVATETITKPIEKV
jgi:hypothetical protein